MVSKFAFLSNLFFISVALAVPPSQLGARSNESHYSEDATPIYYHTYNWAGVSMGSEVNGTYDAVMATFAVPTPSDDKGGFSMTIGIDGVGDCTAALQTGVKVLFTDGVASYNAWYAWYPEPVLEFPYITVNPGDVIDAYVVVTSTTAGVVIMVNRNTSEVSSVEPTSPESSALCGRYVEWVVEDIQLEDSTYAPFANFSTALFTNAVACGPNYTYYAPSTGDIPVIVQNDSLLTFVSTAMNDIFIQYL